MGELVFEREAAAEYDRAFAHVTRYFMPFVLRAARVAPGMRVLDIAAGTGLSAEAALSADRLFAARDRQPALATISAYFPNFCTPLSGHRRGCCQTIAASSRSPIDRNIDYGE